MAWYPKATRKNIPPGPNDPPIKARVVILHVAASETPSLYPYFNGPSGGVESHFYIRYDGTVEQYRDTDYQADANVMANDFAISIETQGLANGTWTAAQLAAIKALLTWCHDVHGIPLEVPKTWDGSGVGYHVLFEDQWDQRGAVCPGPKRIDQFKTVLVPWMASAGNTQSEEDDMTPEQAKQLQEIHDRLYGIFPQRYGKTDAAGVWHEAAGPDAKGNLAPGVVAAHGLDEGHGNVIVREIRAANTALLGVRNELAKPSLEVDVTALADDLATALGPDIGKQVVDALTIRLNSKES